MSQLQSPAAFEQWKGGVPFSFAIVCFGDARLVQLYREADTIGSITANRIMLVIDLWERLREGELLAFGRKILPTPSDGPVLIRPDIFYDRPPALAGESDDLEGSTWRYESVRVAMPDPDSALEPLVPNASQPQKRGPKPFASMVAAAIIQLKADDSDFADRSQEKQIEAIRCEVARQNPARFPRSARPGHTTVWNYLTGRKSLR